MDFCDYKFRIEYRFEKTKSGKSIHDFYFWKQPQESLESRINPYNQLFPSIDLQAFKVQDLKNTIQLPDFAETGLQTVNLRSPLTSLFLKILI